MKQKDILFLFISSSVLVFAWIGFNLYHKWVTTTINADLQIQINPIDPQFDMQTLNNLKQREQIVPIYTLDKKTQPSITLSPTPPLVISPTIPLQQP